MHRHTHTQTHTCTCTSFSHSVPSPPLALPYPSVLSLIPSSLSPSPFPPLSPLSPFSPLPSPLFSPHLPSPSFPPLVPRLWWALLVQLQGLHLFSIRPGEITWPMCLQKITVRLGDLVWITPRPRPPPPTHTHKAAWSAHTLADSRVCVLLL